MLSQLDARWFARCDGCLAVPPLDVELRIRELARAEVVAALDELGWEIAAGDRAWCVDCSRRRREVPFRRNSRGVRLGRRRTK